MPTFAGSTTLSSHVSRNTTNSLYLRRVYLVAAVYIKGVSGLHLSQCLEGRPVIPSVRFSPAESSASIVENVVGLVSLFKLIETVESFFGKEKNPWLLGKMFESRFPHASGREEG